MFKLAFYLVLLFMGHQVAGVLDPGYEFVREAHTWLRLHMVPAEWSDARQRCQLEGGILASPSTAALANAMKSMMKKYMGNNRYRSVFTGIHDLISEGDFMSLDGVPLSDFQLNWAGEEPNKGEEVENCVVLTHYGEVADVRCSSKHPYFCSKSNAIMSVVKPECRTTDFGYNYHDRTGSCYKFHRVGQTWHQAARTCHAEGGHLAIINSDTEAQVIKDIFYENQPNTLVGVNFDHLAWIGVWKWNSQNGEWLTVNGTPLDYTGFSLWSQDQPNTVDGSQTVCAVERAGTLNNASPHYKEAFICEINFL